ncbi:energy-coupling factor ABC transporter ATP-binding protein [Paracoccaceae bacterium GXU_MW_L88]
MTTADGSITDGATAQVQPSGITLSDLTYAIDEKPILHGLTATLTARRIGIVGRNGSGKSTLARLLAGLIAPSSGTVSLGGIDPAKDRKAALRHVGILFQNPDHQIIFPTVIEEITFGLRQLGKSKAEAEASARQTLESFGKSHWQDAHITALSQGQKHLLCLMAVSAMQPRIILLDEPFTGLDLPTRLQLRRYLARYKGQLVHISHEPEDLSDYDHVLWLEQGRIAQSGPAAAVLAAYVTEMTRQGGEDDLTDLPG